MDKVTYNFVIIFDNLFWEVGKILTLMKRSIHPSFYDKLKNLELKLYYYLING